MRSLTLALTAALLVFSVGYARSNNPGADLVLALGETLELYQPASASSPDDANNARLLLWELQQPGTLSTCTFLLMEDAVNTGRLTRDAAVFFLADLTDGTDSLTECDASTLGGAEAQLTALSIDVPGTPGATLTSAEVSQMLRSVKGDARSLQSTYARNNQ